MVPRAGIEPARLAARDFESRASTCSAISATQASIIADSVHLINTERPCARVRRPITCVDTAGTVHIDRKHGVPATPASIDHGPW